MFEELLLFSKVEIKWYDYQNRHPRRQLLLYKHTDRICTIVNMYIYNKFASCTIFRLSHVFDSFKYCTNCVNNNFVVHGSDHIFTKLQQN